MDLDERAEIEEIFPARTEKPVKVAKPPKAPRPPRAPLPWARWRRRAREVFAARARLFTIHGAVALFVIGTIGGAGLTRAAMAPSPNPSASPGDTADPAGTAGADASPSLPLPTLALRPDGHRRFVTDDSGMPQSDWAPTLLAFMDRLPESVTAARVNLLQRAGFPRYWQIDVSGPADLTSFATDLQARAAATGRAVQRTPLDGGFRVAAPGFVITAQSWLEAGDPDIPGEIRIDLTILVDTRAIAPDAELVPVDGPAYDVGCVPVDAPKGFPAEVAAALVSVGGQDVHVLTGCDQVAGTEMILGWVRGEPDGADVAADIARRFRSHGVDLELSLATDDSVDVFYGSVVNWMRRPGMVGHESDGNGTVPQFFVIADPLRPGWYGYCVILGPLDLDAQGRLVPDPVP